jgi:hypothetical protein
MATRTAPRRRPASRLPLESGYDRAWTTVALLAAAVWVAIAILQTPPVPLLALASALGAIGGVLFVRAPATSVLGRGQYVAGALGVAGLAMVTVGVAHHLTVGLAVVAALACSAPAAVRWITSLSDPAQPTRARERSAGQDGDGLDRDQERAREDDAGRR